MGLYLRDLISILNRVPNDVGIFSRQGISLGNAFGPGNGSIWLDDVTCRGNEPSLGDCLHEPWGSHNCLHTEDVSISCHEGPPAIGNCICLVVLHINSRTK